jgi:hypothetical protein
MCLAAGQTSSKARLRLGLYACGSRQKEPNGTHRQKSPTFFTTPPLAHRTCDSYCVHDLHGGGVQEIQGLRGIPHHQMAAVSGEPPAVPEGRVQQLCIAKVVQGIGPNPGGLVGDLVQPARQGRELGGVEPSPVSQGLNPDIGWRGPSLRAS